MPLHINKDDVISLEIRGFPKRIKPLSPFVSKLRFLVNNSKYKHAIHWSADGKSIVITDVDTFKRCILNNEDEMFKTRNFTSFVRQLNLYGFRKLQTSGKSDPSANMVFEHIYFRRDRPDFMNLVHRTCLVNKKKCEPISSTPNKKLSSILQDITESDDSISKDTSRASSKKSLHRLKLEFPSQKVPNSMNSHRKVLGERFENTNIINGEVDNLLFDTSLDTSIDIEDTETKMSPSYDEHDYALPNNVPNFYSTFDEKSTYEFLNRTFINEKEAIQTLLSLQSTSKSLSSTCDALQTLADVSAKVCLENSTTMLENDTSISSTSSTDSSQIDDI